MELGAYAVNRLRRSPTIEFYPWNAQLVLTRYGLERLLYRLTQSQHAEQFVLKGAALFQLWTGEPHRSTRDLDLLGHGEPSTDRLRQLFQDVCSQAMVQLGMANSRMKDFYDVWSLAGQFEFDGIALCAAIRATFQRRQTEPPATTPLALTPEFSRDRNKAIQWSAFLRKGRLLESPPPLEESVTLLASFLMPPTLALVSNEPWDRTWAAMEWR